MNISVLVSFTTDSNFITAPLPLIPNENQAKGVLFWYNIRVRLHFNSGVELGVVMSGLVNVNDKPNMWEQLINRIDRSVSWNSGLEGRMLTLIDASISDREQREAFKSIVRQAIRDHYNETNRTISAIVNLFTDVFDGETIKYTKTSNYPYGDNDSRDSIQPQTVNDFIK